MKTSTIAIRFIVLSLSTLLLAGCQSAKGTSLQEKRDYSLSMLDESLEMLYAEKPEQREVIADAVGYGAFSNFGAHIFVLSTGNGDLRLRPAGSSQELDGGRVTAFESHGQWRTLERVA